MSHNKAGNFISGVIVGAAAGAIAGLLLAPKSGEETRKDIRAKAEELKSKAEDLYSDASKMVQKKIDQLKGLGTKIDREKYMAVVQEVVAEMKDSRKASVEKSKELGQLLHDDWDKVKKAIVS